MPIEVPAFDPNEKPAEQRLVPVSRPRSFPRSEPEMKPRQRTLQEYIQYLGEEGYFDVVNALRAKNRPVWFLRDDGSWAQGKIEGSVLDTGVYKVWVSFTDANNPETQYTLIDIETLVWHHQKHG